MTQNLFIAGKQGRVRDLAVAVFHDRKAAEAWAASASAWYGEGHPLYPLTVWGHTVQLDPTPFPAPAADESDAEIRRIFESL